MFKLGLQEVLMILGLVIVIFGVKRLPQIGKNLGEGIKNFKWSLKEVGKAVTGEDDEE